jgi:hypothetical protein
MRTTIPWDALKRAMLPLDGSIHQHAPAMVQAFAGLLSRRQWHLLTYADLTAGSCLLPLVFAAAGAKRVIVNDVAPRTTLAARALFGGETVDADVLPPRWKGHVPSFHFACDYLLAEAAQVFDRHYFARPASPIRQYLALRWIMGFATGVDGDFDILLTHDKERLAAKTDGNWGAYLARLARPKAVLRKLAAEINPVVRLVAGMRAEVHEEDLLTLAPKLRWGEGPLLVAINPPTRGLDEYTIDDQLVHSLLANRWLPLSEWHEDHRTFWTTRVKAAMAALPAGAWYIVYGGDGAMNWRDCMKVWAGGGEVQVEQRDGRGGWAIFRKPA